MKSHDLTHSGASGSSSLSRDDEEIALLEMAEDHYIRHARRLLTRPYASRPAHRPSSSRLPSTARVTRSRRGSIVTLDRHQHDLPSAALEREAHEVAG